LHDNPRLLRGLAFLGFNPHALALDQFEERLPVECSRPAVRSLRKSVQHRVVNLDLACLAVVPD
jgi:hypothetical protein